MQSKYLKKMGYSVKDIKPYLDVIVSVRENEMKRQLGMEQSLIVWRDTDKIISAKHGRREATGFWRWNRKKNKNLSGCHALGVAAFFI